MALSFGSGVTTIQSFWTAFKATVSSKNLLMQYQDDGSTITVFAMDGVLLYYTLIYNGAVPDQAIQQGYSQAQNDADKTDFNTNFAPMANATTQPASKIGAGVPTSGTYISGTDGTNLRGILVDSTGQQKVLIQNTPNVNAVQSGVWTVQPGNTQNSTAWLVQDSADGPVGAGTAATKSMLQGVVFNTALPTLTDGQQAAAQADSRGRLLIGSIASALPTGGNTIGAVTGSGTFTVAGAVTANIGTSGSLALDASVTGLQVAQGSTTSGQKGSLFLGAVTTAAPSYTTAQSSPLSLTTAGALRVDASATTQPVSGTVTVTQGTAANLNATIAPLTNSSVVKAQLQDNSGTALSATGSSLNVNITGGSTSAAVADKTSFTYGTTSETPIGGVYQDTSPSLTAGTTGTVRLTANRAFHINLRDASGNEKLGSSTSANSIPVVIASDQGAVPVSGTITANIGTTNGLALDTSVNGILVSQGSTTSGQKGPLIQGAVTTASPSYTTAQTSPLSLTTAGALRTDASATTQPVSGTVTVTQGTAANLNATVVGTVTANIGTTNGLALDATVAKLTIAQGAALGANTQALIGGSVTTAAPSYTAGQISPLSLTTAGALRVDATGPTKIADTEGIQITSFPVGFMRTSDEPKQLFYDPFDSTLDTINRWAAPVSSGGGVAGAVAGGVLTLGSGTTASGYSYVASQPSFAPSTPAWIGYSFAIKIENPVLTNSYRFWGAGTNPATPTTAAPLTNAIGYEVDTAGKMYAVIYAAGARTVIQDLSAATGNSKQPTDANYHTYIIYYRIDKTFFYIDGIDGNSQVASANFISPNVQTLPVKFLSIAFSTPPSSSAIINCNSLAVWDTGKNNTTLSDGTYPWRKASIDTSGNLRVAASAPTGTVPILYDSFDATVSGGNFNVALWTRGGSGGSVTNNTGYLTLSDGSSPGVANGISTLTPLAFSGEGQPLTLDFILKLGASLLSQHAMEWGWGKYASIGFSGSIPTSEGALFYASTAGEFSASIVSGGVRTTVKTLTYPTDTYFHKYRITKTEDTIAWYIDDMTNPVATLSLPTTPFPMYGTGNVFVQTDNVVSGFSNSISIAMIAAYTYSGSSVRISDAIYPQRRGRLDTVGSQLITDWEHAGLHGTIPGVRSITTMGYVTTAATTVTAVRGTAWTQVITAASTFHVVSSSASDTNGQVAGGAWSALIYWWDQNNNYNTTTVLMNGTTTVVVTMTNCILIEKMEVNAFSSAGPNVGTISIKNSADTITYMTIAPGDGRTYVAQAVVKGTGAVVTGLGQNATIVGVIKRIRVSANGSSGYLFLKQDCFMQPPGNVAGTLKPVTDQIRVITGQPTLVIEYNPGLYVYAGSTLGPIPVQAYVQADTVTSTKWWVSFDMLEVSL